MTILNRFLIGEGKGRILDFGCGKGEAVLEARKNGLDIVGCDNFEGQYSKFFADVVDEKVIFRVENDRLPFEDNTFDLIIANQVFEHVHDLETILSEIYRVLKPEGTLRTAFPTKNCVFDGHVLMYFVPQLEGRLRWYALYLQRRLGLGVDELEHVSGNSNARSLNARQWADMAATKLNKNVVYRYRRSLKKSFGKYFHIRHVEHEYIPFHLPKYRLCLWWPFSFLSRKALQLFRTDVWECRPYEMVKS